MCYADATFGVHEKASERATYLPARFGLHEMSKKSELIAGACVSLLLIACTARTIPADTNSVWVASFDTSPHSRHKIWRCARG